MSLARGLTSKSSIYIVYWFPSAFNRYSFSKHLLSNLLYIYGIQSQENAYHDSNFPYPLHLYIQTTHYYPLFSRIRFTLGLLVGVPVRTRPDPSFFVCCCVANAIPGRSNQCIHIAYTYTYTAPSPVPMLQKAYKATSATLALI